MEIGGGRIEIEGLRWGGQRREGVREQAEEVGDDKRRREIRVKLHPQTTSDP